MLPLVIQKPLRTLVVGSGKAAMWKFKSVSEAGFPLTCLTLSPETVPEGIEVIKGDLFAQPLSYFDPFWLIYLALPNTPELCALAERLIEGGKLVNVCSCPSAGNFIHPATRRRGSRMVSVSTGGADPARAVWLAEKFAGMLDDS